MRKKWLIYCIALFMFVVAANAVDAQNNVIVPNVSGIPHDVAAHLLRVAGLRPIVKFDAQRSLIIAQQSPKPGTLVIAGSEVILSTGTSNESRAAVQAVPTYQPETSYVLPQQETSSRSITIQAVPQSQPITTPRAPQAMGSLPWYPKKFLGPVQDVEVKSILRNRSLSTGTSNILNVTPYSKQQSKPVILRNARGWQQGWHVQGWEPGTSTVSTVQGSGDDWSSIQGGSGDALPADVIAVPPVAYLPLSDASAALRKAGLSVGSVRKIDDPQAQRGVVTQQSPDAHSLVPRGTAIQLWVAN